MAGIVTTVRAEPRIPWSTVGVSVALTLVPLTVFLRGDPAARQILLALAALAIGAYAATIHPLSIFAALAVVLGAAPYSDIPGSDIPVVLTLAVGAWVALIFVPGVQFRPGWCELVVFALAATALLSVLATGLSGQALLEYLAWATATAVVVPVRSLPAPARVAMARVFAWSTAATSAVGLVLIRIDPAGAFLSRLEFFGYDSGVPDPQLVANSDGDVATRLTGTLVNANTGALILVVGLVLAVAYVRGWQRVILVVLIGSALMLTLSRSAIGTVAVAGLLLALRTTGRQRRTIIASGLAAGLGVLALPGVLGRLLDSFGPGDVASAARAQALQQFPHVMEGHWVWGLGWDREEFRNIAVFRIVNFAANAPLATIYRGGLILGILAVIVLAVIVVRSWVLSRRSFEDAVVCCGAIAFVLVALQLDYLVVIDIPGTVVFSMLLGFVLHARATSEGMLSRA